MSWEWRDLQEGKVLKTDWVLVWSVAVIVGSIIGVAWLLGWRPL